MSTKRYTEQHEWVEVSGDTATAGITIYAAEQLGDIVYVELPEPGKVIGQSEEIAVVESVKAASEVYAPVSGEVIEVNDALVDEPEKVNHAAEAAGWFVKLRLSDEKELAKLMDEDGYKIFVEGLAS